MNPGDRVRIDYSDPLFDRWNARHHRNGTKGTIVRLPNPRSPFHSRQLFYVIRHDDGEHWSYGRGQFTTIEDDHES